MTAVTSLFFGLYLIVSVPVYWLLPAGWRRHFLLAASLTFLGLASLPLTSLFLALCVFIYRLGRMLYDGTKGRPVFVLGLMIPTLVLAYYKYTPMLIETFNAAGKFLPRHTPLTVPNILAPVGISFFTFKLLHYLINCYKKETPPGSFWHFLMYMAFFPVFTSGPIERWPHFAAQNPAFAGNHMFTGIARILTGLFKKKVLADNLIIFAGVLQVQNSGGLGYWLAAYAYAFQLYFDFSGYSDIAIGSARLFGYEIMENFNWPYLQALLEKLAHDSDRLVYPIHLYSPGRQQGFFPPDGLQYHGGHGRHRHMARGCLALYALGALSRSGPDHLAHIRPVNRRKAWAALGRRPVAEGCQYPGDISVCSVGVGLFCL